MNSTKNHIAGQFLTFGLDGEVFALGISKIREVLELPHVTRVPRLPGHIRGVINLRGHAVPVMDLRARFGMPPGKDTVDTCIIITEMQRENDSTHLGMLVDSVREVIEMDAGQVEDAPSLGMNVDTAFLRGIGRRGDGFVLILDTDRIITEREMALLERHGRESAEAA